MGLAVLAAVLIGSTTPAAAKGPESATVSGPGFDGSIDLMDKANADLVVRLMEQTGLWYATGDVPLPIEEPAGDLGPSYTLTWVNSGPPSDSVQERTIRQVIYLDARSGPVVQTPIQEGLEGWGPEVIGWFAAPSGLRDTLAELGVPVAEASLLGDAPLSELSTDAVPPGGESVSAAWFLAVAGLALVVGLAWGVWRPALARQRQRLPQP